MTTHKGFVNCCNKIRERRACNYCGYPESEAAFPETKDLCSCEFEDKRRASVEACSADHEKRIDAVFKDLNEERINLREIISNHLTYLMLYP